MAVRERQSGETGEFQAVGWSEVEAYARHAPHMLRTVTVRPAEVKPSMERLATLGVDVPVMAARGSLTRSPVAQVVIGMLDESALVDEGASTIVALDHVTDPRNFGAIVRSAAFFGVAALLVPRRRQVLLTQAVVAAAQGGFALVQSYACVNLARRLRALKEAGYWIVGADGGGGPLASWEPFDRQVVVLGAEDKGISRNVQTVCDVLVGIPGAADFDSLNVAVAAGIILNHLKA